MKRGYAVIIVDWGEMNQVTYWQSAANIRTVGAAVGYSVLKWNVSSAGHKLQICNMSKLAEKTLLVGFSLGGQAVGDAGRYVIKNGDKGQKIAECHGLDPAGPWFDPLESEFVPDIQLDKDDCKLVQVVHTSASYNSRLGLETATLLSFGTVRKSGHCDFWVNCGHKQGSMCSGSTSFTQLIQALSVLNSDGGESTVEFLLSHACSHFRSAQMYADAVLGNCDKSAMGYVCPDCGPTEPKLGESKKECTARPDLGQKAFPPDNDCSPDDDQNYVVFSTNQAPFCEGTQD